MEDCKEDGDVVMSTTEGATATEDMEEKTTKTESILMDLEGANRGKPCANREQTVQVMTRLMDPKSYPDDGSKKVLSRVHGRGPLLLSDIPANCRPNKASGGVVVGIDEAGRGCVVGPMVYGAAFWQDDNPPTDLPKELTDSKALSEETRSSLLKAIMSNADEIGWAARVIPAAEISRNMNRKAPYNLNQMSHDAAMEMVRAILEAGITIRTLVVDTVGSAAPYQRKLAATFPSIETVLVEAKADAKYPSCSAASIVAKVVRDNMLHNTPLEEPHLASLHPHNFGSGYPSDPKCKAWISQQVDPVFGFPSLVRFSWAPAKKLLAQEAVNVIFQADLDEDEEEAQAGLKRQREQMSCFLSKDKTLPEKDASANKRYPYFQRKHLQAVTTIF